jgi:hypothetical protein
MFHICVTYVPHISHIFVTCLRLVHICFTYVSHMFHNFVFWKTPIFVMCVRVNIRNTYRNYIVSYKLWISWVCCFSESQRPNTSSTNSTSTTNCPSSTSTTGATSTTIDTAHMFNMNKYDSSATSRNTQELHTRSNTTATHVRHDYTYTHGYRTTTIAFFMKTCMICMRIAINCTFECVYTRWPYTAYILQRKSKCLINTAWILQMHTAWIVCEQFLPSKSTNTGE